MADNSSFSATPKDVCVIGASAGGVQSLQAVLGRLPADHPGSVLVVLHLAAAGPSMLASVLARSCALPCEAAVDGEPLRPGRVYVARPNLHLAVGEDGLVVSGGPRENGHRPSVDVLFRTAAAVLGPRVLGIVLSGTGDDGTAGLAAIKRRGGTVAVQDPDQALHEGMPVSAIEQVAVDVVGTTEVLGDLIVSAAAGSSPSVALGGGAELEEGTGELLSVVCPECGGTLRDTTEDGVPAFGCHVGHRFTMGSLIDEQRDAVERALWTAARTLEDRGLLLRDMAERAESQGRSFTARSWRRRAAEADADVRLLREALERQAAFDSALPDLQTDIQ
jgi:two-component system, chemotaxis family, protein-glutamate methylesterase/glutaminase